MSILLSRGWTRPRRRRRSGKRRRRTITESSATVRGCKENLDVHAVIQVERLLSLLPCSLNLYSCDTQSSCHAALASTWRQLILPICNPLANSTEARGRRTVVYDCMGDFVVLANVSVDVAALLKLRCMSVSVCVGRRAWCECRCCLRPLSKFRRHRMANANVAMRRRSERAASVTRLASWSACHQVGSLRLAVQLCHSQKTVSDL